MVTKYRVMLSISGFNSTHKDMPNYKKELGSSLGFHIYSKVPGGRKKTLTSRLNRWSFDFFNHYSRNNTVLTTIYMVCISVSYIVSNL